MTAADEQAFYRASDRLAAALERVAEETVGREVSAHEEIAAARLGLRTIAVKMRDAGYWRNDKQGLRATVALLWQADRHVNDHALRSTDTVNR